MIGKVKASTLNMHDVSVRLMDGSSTRESLFFGEPAQHKWQHNCEVQ